MLCGGGGACEAVPVTQPSKTSTWAERNGRTYIGFYATKKLNKRLEALKKRTRRPKGYLVEELVAAGLDKRESGPQHLVS